MQGNFICTKRLLIVCLLLVSGTSQASTNSLNKQDGTTLSVARTVISNEARPVRTRTASKPNVTKLLPKVKRQQQQLLTSQSAEDNDSDSFDELDFQVGFRRPELVEDEEEQLSDRIMDRLANARALAMAKHKEIWQANT